MALNKQKEVARLCAKAVEEYGNMRAQVAAEAAAEEQQVELIKKLMDTMKLSLEQAMNALKISEPDVAYVHLSAVE
jgi:ribosome maturation protein Sdo1